MHRLTTLLLLPVLLCAAAATRAAGEPVLYAVEVSHAGPDGLRALRADEGVRWWAELGDLLVVAGTDASEARASRRFASRRLDGPREGELLWVGRRVHSHALDETRAAALGARLLATSGVFAVVAATPEAAGALDAHEPGAVTPLERNHTYARSSVNEPARPVAAAKAAELAAYAGAVDVERWRATVRDLVDFRTRYTGTAGALGARDYIAARFAELGLDVTTEAVPVGGRTAYNVVGELRGTTRAADVYVVCGHYDSVSEQPETLAPGAEDNASGAAGVVELARLFAADPPEATVRFVAFSGEEQGLYGSREHVDRLERSGEISRLKAVVNMDMIAFSRDDDLDVLLETGAVGRDLSEALAESAAAVTSLRVVRSFNPFGSDHVPFINAGVACVLTIENDWDDYSSYHTSRDSMENVRDDMGAEVLRMNAAALGALAGGDADDAPAVSVSVPFATNRTTIYGGFVQTVDWAVANAEAERFELEYSLDNGASFSPIATVAGDARSHAWVVPAGLKSAKGVIRVTAYTPEGEAVAGTSERRLAFKAANGPFVKAIKFKSAANFDFFLKGRFSAEYSRIEVDGVAVGATLTDARYVDGNTAKRLHGRVDDLDAVFPRGVAVRVRVVELRTGLATDELVVAR